MKCFYHSADLDGHCSGAIVKRFYQECELIGINYGQPFPWDTIENNEPVFMVDFCLQPFEDMIRLANMATLVWIDHHKSAIEESIANHVNLAIPGLRAVGLAGCELTWKYIQNYVKRDVKEKEPVPVAVTLLGRYDVWDQTDAHKWDDDILPFQYGMLTETTDPAELDEEGEDLWERLLRPVADDDYSEAAEETLSMVADISNKGGDILDYIWEEYAKYMKVAAHDVMFEGLKCLAINRLLVNSLIFESMWDPNKYDAMLAYGWRGKSWTVSLYTDRPDIDVSEIARKRGGGGHKGAAGFQCDELPWKEAINL